MPRRAPAVRTPSVPVTSNPLPSATAVPLRSSIRMRSAWIDSASVIAACSPAPSDWKRSVVYRFNPYHLGPRRKLSYPLANHERSRGMAELLVHGVPARTPFPTIAAKAQSDRWKAGKKWGWCLPQPGASKAQSLQAPAFSFRVFHGCSQSTHHGPEKLIELEAGLNSQEALQLGLGETVVLVSSAASASSARRDKSPPSAASRWARSSGMWTVTVMAIFLRLTCKNS